MLKYFKFTVWQGVGIGKIKLGLERLGNVWIVFVSLFLSVCTNTFFPCISSPAIETNSSSPVAEHSSKLAPVGAEGRDHAICRKQALKSRKKKC